ncbi:hypothetical protein AS181_22030 [Gordonia sp. SGD-V-85]|nr:hypothetical protein AS181_22030 [Gordonia sp. SGD-V-85]
MGLCYYPLSTFERMLLVTLSTFVGLAAVLKECVLRLPELASQAVPLCVIDGSGPESVARIAPH